MKVLMINSVCGIKSTGRICTDIADELTKQGYEVKIAYGRESVPDKYKKYAVRIGCELGVKWHGLLSRITDKSGLYSKCATKKFIKWVKEFNPDIIHLHNLHGYYINYEILFKYLRTCGKKIIWTLHDCWAFTGHCAYFSWGKCEKWKTNCEKCKQKKNYPQSLLFDNSKGNFLKKKKLFMGIKDLTIVTPSVWLKDLVGQSFLKEYKVEVINNGVSACDFKPIESDFRQKHQLENKKIILGVASVWDARKGLKDFVELYELIDDRYKIVLVGVNKKQIETLPKGILCVENTNCLEELAQIYTCADVLVNTTYEDNYPTVNLEAQRCGTPVITYKTGGSVESVPENNVVEQGDVRGVLDKINNCELALKDDDFDKIKSVNKYVEIYR